jgi:phospholipid-binding lipoprotein MlaA
MMRQPLHRWITFVAMAAWLALVSGCATGPNANPKDPLEPMNRSISKFNEVLDDNVLKPTAKGYRDVTPQLVQTGVRNVFNNLSDIWSTVNNGLQLKGRDTAESLMRSVVNTVFGIYGIFDVATEIGLERHPEDFGQTLGAWGVPNGPYLVLPLFGPSTLRDAAGMPVDTSVDYVRNLDHIATRNSALAVRIIDKRSGLLDAGNMLNQAAIDKYTFTRDAYLQYRRNQVFDGNPPDEDDLVDLSPEPVTPSAK